MTSAGVREPAAAPGRVDTRRRGRPPSSSVLAACGHRPGRGLDAEPVGPRESGRPGELPHQRAGRGQDVRRPAGRLQLPGLSVASPAWPANRRPPSAGASASRAAPWSRPSPGTRQPRTASVVSAGLVSGSTPHAVVLVFLARKSRTPTRRSRRPIGARSRSPW